MTKATLLNRPSTSDAASDTKPKSDSNKPEQRLSVGRELAETTWRMTVPVVLFAGLGIFLDRTIGSKPWMTLLGTIVGFLLAGAMVKRQINRIPVTPLGKKALADIKKRNEELDKEKEDYYSDGKTP